MVRFIISDRTVFTIIAINAVALFLDAFPAVQRVSHNVLFWIDYGCAIFFVLEISLKVREFTFRGYWSSAWNRFDFLIVAISLPVLLSPFQLRNRDSIFFEGHVPVWRTARDQVPGQHAHRGI